MTLRTAKASCANSRELSNVSPDWYIDKLHAPQRRCIGATRCSTAHSRTVAHVLHAGGLKMSCPHLPLHSTVLVLVCSLWWFVADGLDSTFCTGCLSTYFSVQGRLADVPCIFEGPELITGKPVGTRRSQATLIPTVQLLSQLALVRLRAQVISHAGESLRRYAGCCAYSGTAVTDGADSKDQFDVDEITVASKLQKAPGGRGDMVVQPCCLAHVLARRASGQVSK